MHPAWFPCACGLALVLQHSRHLLDRPNGSTHATQRQRNREGFAALALWRAAQIAERTGAHVTEVRNVIIWGNHSSSQYPDVAHGTVGGTPIPEAVKDDAWLKGAFVSTVQQRGAAIIQARLPLRVSGAFFPPTNPNGNPTAPSGSRASDLLSLQRRCSGHQSGAHPCSVNLPAQAMQRCLRVTPGSHTALRQQLWGAAHTCGANKRRRTAKQSSPSAPAPVPAHLCQNAPGISRLLMPCTGHREAGT